MSEVLHFPPQEVAKLEPHLPPPRHATQQPQPDPRRGPLASAANTVPSRPFVTLTFATSLDSALSLAPGVRTALSGPESKAMTHFLRYRHDAICVGVGTAIADDPGLNCRLDAATGVENQPRPIVIDPQCRWRFSESSKVLQLVRAGRGLAPFIVTSLADPPAADRQLLEKHGGKYLQLCQIAGDGGCSSKETSKPLQWADILRLVAGEGLQSIMVEGGGQIINSLLEAPNNILIDSVIVTIAPTWLGQGGVVVSPRRRSSPDGNPAAAARLGGVSWHQLGEDVVLCGKIKRE